MLNDNVSLLKPCVQFYPGLRRGRESRQHTRDNAIDLKQRHSRLYEQQTRIFSLTQIPPCANVKGNFKGNSIEPKYVTLQVRA